MTILFKKLKDGAVVPTRGSAGAAGFDLYANQGCTIFPQERVLFDTGVAVQIPDGYVGNVRPRSGLASLFGIDVLAGVIDSDYRGELKAMLINHGNIAVNVNRGDRIAQLVVTPVLTEHAEVHELDDTDRGGDGFGSTGV